MKKLPTPPPRPTDAELDAARSHVSLAARTAAHYEQQARDCIRFMSLPATDATGPGEPDSQERWTTAKMRHLDAAAAAAHAADYYATLARTMADSAATCDENRRHAAARAQQRKGTP